MISDSAARDDLEERGSLPTELGSTGFVQTVSQVDSTTKEKTVSFRRIGAAVAVAAVLLGSSAACSSSKSKSSDPTGSTGTAGSKAASLSVAGYGPIAAAATLYIPLIEGYFKDENINLKIVQSGASTVLTNVVSGHTDLGTIGGGVPVNAAAKGKTLPIIYTLTRGLFSASVAGSHGATKISDCKRVATLGVGTSSYGGAAIYKKAYKLSYDVVPLSDYATMLAGLSSGAYNCAVAPASVFAPLISSGKATEVLDSTNAATLSALGIPNTIPDGVIFGTTQSLTKNKDAIARFLIAMNKGTEFIRSHTDQEIAQALLTSPDYTGQTLSTLTAQVTSTRPILFSGDNPGFVSSQIWPTALNYYASEGLPGIDPSSSTFGYDKLVDMSYLNAAIQSAGPVK